MLKHAKNSNLKRPDATLSTAVTGKGRVSQQELTIVKFPGNCDTSNLRITESQEKGSIWLADQQIVGLLLIHKSQDSPGKRKAPEVNIWITVDLGELHRWSKRRRAPTHHSNEVLSVSLGPPSPHQTTARRYNFSLEGSPDETERKSNVTA